MLFKDKIILVCYINVTNVDNSDVHRLCSDFANGISNIIDNTVEYFILPVIDSQTRIECINPVLLDEKQYQDIKKKLESIDKEFFKILNKDEDGETTD